MIAVSFLINLEKYSKFARKYNYNRKIFYERVFG